MSLLCIIGFEVGLALDFGWWSILINVLGWGTFAYLNDKEFKKQQAIYNHPELAVEYVKSLEELEITDLKLEEF